MPFDHLDLRSADQKSRLGKRKRDQYTRKACNGCKARKVKCSGLIPCSRCTDSQINCSYAQLSEPDATIRDPNSPSARKLEGLEKFVQTVQEGLNQLVSSTPSDPSTCSLSFPPGHSEITRPHMRRRTLSTVNRDCPSSFENILKLAQSTLAQNGIVSGTEALVDEEYETSEQESDSTAELLHAARPIISLEETRARALVDAFASNALVMYPCVDIELVKRNLSAVYRLDSSLARDLRIIDIEVLKAVLAIGSSSGDLHGDTALAHTLVFSLAWSVESAFNQDLVSEEDVVMACLMCIYFFQRDDRQKAWRMAGFGARTALELCLDLSESGPKEQSTDSRDQRLILLCCVSDLDARSSFMTGLPRAMSDQLKAEQFSFLQVEFPYLYAMLEMNRLGVDVFAILRDPRQGFDLLSERMDYLDFRLKTLQQSFHLGQSAYDGVCDISPAKLSMQTFISMRANHLRLLAQFRSLGTASLAASRPDAVNAVISAARENVSLYEHARVKGASMTLIQATLDHFLMAAVSSMLLAATYNTEKYAPKCRTAFETGIEALESLPLRPRGNDPRRRYSMTHLRRLARQVHIASPPTELGETEKASSPRLDSANGSLEAACTSIGTDCGQTAQELGNKFADLSDFDANVGLWDANWFDMVLQASTIYPVDSSG